ncbi:MAG: cellulose biosynthesis cyclic di-GMP-binding regulatory protein BcsB [Halioglobus sp.]|nr:cellulose biosynthesis cyclic di-GMP-binding regulatory protein BcsB [Halioglobus sp.]
MKQRARYFSEALSVTFAALLMLPLSAAAGSEVLRLSEFRSEGSQLMLRGQAPSAELFIPLSAASRVDAAELELHLVNSIALIEERSVLRVNFNGVTVGQIRLRRDRPEILATVTLPASLWEPGFNRLQFAASQQVEAQCASPDAPELWTELDLYASRLRVDYRATETPLALSDLSDIFGTGIGSAAQVTLLTPPGDNTEMLDRALPMVAQALALRRNYAPLAVRHAHWTTRWPAGSAGGRVTTDEWSDAARKTLSRSAFYWPGAAQQSVHVVVGRRDQLAEILPANIVDSIEGAHLSLERTPAADSR